MSPSLAKDIVKSFCHLIYPPICLHCRGTLQDDNPLLCEICLDLLTLIDPAERCPHCFSADFYHSKQQCPDCHRQKPILNRMAAAFDYVGPAATLVKSMKYSNKPYLCEGLSGYLAAQFLKLQWPMPDLIAPVPIAFTHWIQRGYNQSQLLSQGLSKLLNCPHQEVLTRKSGDYSQAGLTRKQRMTLNGQKISLKANVNLQDKIILLVDDVTTTGSTLRKCAEILIEGCPSHIYGLTVCRSIK